MELYEFLTFLVLLAFSREANGGVAELSAMLKGLRRSLKAEELAPVLDAISADEGVSAALAAGQAGVSAAFTKAGGGQPVSERALLQFLEACKLVRSVIVTLPGGAEGHADLTWQDASAAFQLCGGGGSLDEASFGSALALCGVTKYREVGGMAKGKAVEGFLANVGGGKDEHAVIGAGTF